MRKIKVALITGSDSDLPVMASAVKLLEDFSVPFVVHIASAHRTPAHLKQCVRSAEENGAQVFIAAAGMAAALPGVVAAETSLPVIGVPLEGKALSGMDALFAIVQMPPGIPVATVAVGKAGAVNAALLAVQMLSLSDPELRGKLAAYREKQAAGIVEKDRKLAELGISRYIESK